MLMNRRGLIFLLPVWLCWLLFSCQKALFRQRNLFVPDEFPTIEKAVKNSTSGDTIVVSPGKYSISPAGIHITQKNLTLRAASGAQETVLTGTGDRPLISFGKESQAILDGFTLTVSAPDPNKPCPLHGGGIYCAPYSSPTIINNIIVNQKAQFGGGIYCAHSSAPKILHNTIANNQAGVCGGGIFSFHASARIVQNRFFRNTACFGGAIFCDTDSSLIQNNILAENRASHSGGGCSLIDSAAAVINNTLSRNTALFGGGIFGSAGEFQQINNILWANQDDLCLVDFKMTSRPRFSNIADADYLGVNGNIAQDPLFIDPNQGDYRLKAQSPCRHSGDPQSIYHDPDGSRNTIGAYGGPEAFQ
ncbi:MAG: hypothetical protein AB1611_19820 [bacterium]